MRADMSVYKLSDFCANLDMPVMSQHSFHRQQQAIYEHNNAAALVTSSHAIDIVKGYYNKLQQDWEAADDADDDDADKFSPYLPPIAPDGLYADKDSQNHASPRLVMMESTTWPFHMTDHGRLEAILPTLGLAQSLRLSRDKC